MTTKTVRDAVYELLTLIPKGRVTTYKELGRAVNTGGYRAIGVILNRNPNAPKVPCHRVVMSDGSIGGYVGGVDQKERLLKSEGIEISEGKVVDFASRLYRF